MQALRYFNHLNYYFHLDTMTAAKLIIHRGQIHGAAPRRVCPRFPPFCTCLPQILFLPSIIIPPFLPVSIGLRQLLLLFPLIAWTVGPSW
jgi:hypothetical protein